MNAQTKVEAAPSNVHRRLSEARSKFHAIELKKTGKNTFAGYSYFELGDFLIPALKVFAECGLGTTPITFSDGVATMRIVNLDDPMDIITLQSPMGSAALKGCHEVQNIGAVETYQRRYLWVNALEIVEHDALDSAPPAEQPRKEQAETDTPQGRAEYLFPAGPAKGITELKAMARPVWRDLMSCGDADELEGCILSNKALLNQVSRLENPTHRRELWEGDGKDNPGLHGVIEQQRAAFAKPTILQAG